jgi:penicillin-binding protein 1A
MTSIRNIIDQFFNNADNKSHKTIVKWLWRLMFAGILGIMLLFFILSFTDLPSVKQLENPKSEEASLVYGSDGTVIGRYYTENRVPVEFDQLSPSLVEALVATEDVRYYEHSGIDFRALGRVAVKTIILGQSSSGGASTITQQLAKLLFTKKPGSGLERVMQKLKEWIIAVRLERRYTKEEIIAMYLNKFDFLYQSYGIKAAAETYFNTTQDSLAIEEAAMLVGMLKNPDLYNPIKFPKRAKQRREVVLSQLQKYGEIKQEEYDSLRSLPLEVTFTRRRHIDGIATYFRMETAKDIKEILSRPDIRKRPDGKPFNIYQDGLRIQTTINPKLQKMAEEEMVKHMKQLQATFNRHWKNMDPWTYMGDSEKEIPIEYRKSTLQRLIRETPRYQSIRSQYLGDLISQLEREFPNFNFHSDDREIVRMMNSREERGYFTRLRQQGILTNAQVQEYRDIMKTKVFQKVINQWKNLQQEVERVFENPVKMRVFAYNERMEADTIMSPLDSIKHHRMFLQTGIMAVDPKTGHIKAWVGGINHKYFQYDHVRINRQVGSTFKPFIYATAIALQGISPCFKVADVRQTIGPGDGYFYLQEPWTPDNFNGKFTGEMYTLRRGLAKSKNTVSVYLMKQLGDTDPVRGLVHNMGIDSSEQYSNGIYRVPKAPSICLGVSDLTVMEMAGAYSTFANNGIHVKPVHILSIEDKNGQVIYRHVPEDRRALPENANYVMVDLLRGSAGVYGLESDVGGKTGTTNDFVDGWFMGITPDLVVGTWVGGADRWIRFRLPSLGQGSYMAKPFFQRFMKRVENTEGLDYDKTKNFYRPPGDLGIELDCSKYETDGLGPNEEVFDTDPFSENQFGDEIIHTNPGNNPGNSSNN